MQTVDIRGLELMEAWQDSDPAHSRVRSDFPINAATGAQSTAVVYFELDPGHHLGRHTDSAEETLVLLSGTADVTVGDVTTTVSAPALALVPDMVPHELTNTGDETLRVVGFFSRARVTSTFDEPLMPLGATVFEQGTEPAQEPVAAAPSR